MGSIGTVFYQRFIRAASESRRRTICFPIVTSGALSETNQRWMLRAAADLPLRSRRPLWSSSFVSGNANEKSRRAPFRAQRTRSGKRRLKTGGEVPGVLIAFPAQFTFNQRESPLVARASCYLLAIEISLSSPPPSRPVVLMCRSRRGWNT